VDFASIGYLAMLPHLTSFIFLNLGGLFGDYLLKMGLKTLSVRKICNTIGFGGAGVCLTLIPSFDTVGIVMGLMCLGNAFSGMAAGGFIVNHADIGPKYTGTLMGITNMIGAVPGIIGVYLAGLILNEFGSWAAVFYVVAGVTFFGMIFYLIFASADKQFD
jgi:ACS family sodium-dependent inorganic phosphate cotransporter